MLARFVSLLQEAKKPPKDDDDKLKHAAAAEIEARWEKEHSVRAFSNIHPVPAPWCLLHRDPLSLHCVCRRRAVRAS